MQAGQTRCKLSKPDAIRDDPDAPRCAQAHPGAPIRTQAHADPSRRKQARTALKTLAFPNDLRRAPRDDWPYGDGVLDDREPSETAQPGDCGVFIAAPRGDSVSVKADCGVWNASRGDSAAALSNATRTASAPKGVLNSYPAWNDGSGVSKGVSNSTLICRRTTSGLLTCTVRGLSSGGDGALLVGVGALFAAGFAPPMAGTSLSAASDSVIGTDRWARSCLSSSSSSGIGVTCCP